MLPTCNIISEIDNINDKNIIYLVVKKNTHTHPV